MTYFDKLPIELNTIIISYTLPKDYDNIIKIINKVDYYQLLKSQFKYYYFDSTISAVINVKELYLDIIKLFHLKYDKFFRDRVSYEEALDIFKQGNIRLDMFNNSLQNETIEYLMINGIINLDVHYIAKIDSIKLYTLFIEKLAPIRMYDSVLIYNSHKLLNYMIKCDDYKLYIKLEIIPFYQKELINLETTKIIFNNIEFTDNRLLEMLSYYNVHGDIEVFKYILNKISDEYVDEDKIIENLMSNIDFYDYFRLIYYKFENKLSNNNIFKLYKQILQGINIDIDINDNIIKIVTFMAQKQAEYMILH